MNKTFKSLLTPTVLIAALGYFVDMFDITLFGVVRTPSLNALGYTETNDLINYGVGLYNFQMGGMLLGGIFWGILGDKKGRHTVLYSSILMYSIANILNAFVTNIEQYQVLRFLAGVGLAGELGAAVTLVAESLPKETRGWATTLVATLGMLGGLTAALVGKYFHWQQAYIVGGVMGILLLIARFKNFDSTMFLKLKEKNIKRGQLSLFLNIRRILRYLASVGIGLPIYFITGILLTLAPEVTAEMNMTSPVTAADALIWGTIGLATGDLLSGVLSQLFKSRKKAIGLSIGLAAILVAIYLNLSSPTHTLVYFICFLLGTCAGYWAVLVTVAAEQFGTNIRSTVATSVPNFVRGSGMIVAFSFVKLKSIYSVHTSVLLIGSVVFAISFISLISLRETFGTELDYIEE